MRQIIFILFILLVFVVGCEKSNEQPINDEEPINVEEPDKVLVDLWIVAVNTPGTKSQGQDIISNVRCSGSDLCYRFSNFDVKEIKDREFEIRAKATYPNPRKGNFACAQAIYTIDTSLKISTPSKGQYILKFYNQNSLFKSDTVQVN